MRPRLPMLAALLPACAVGVEDVAPILQDLPESEEAWDPTPGDLPAGTRISIRIVCGLLDGPQDKLWELTETGEWRELRPDDSVPQPVAYPELEGCFGLETDKLLRWYEDGDVFIRAGGLDHDLSPTRVERRWFGGVEPAGESRDPQECAEGMAEHGLSWPVPLTMELLDLEEP